jgi:hypothetical protein
MRIRDCVVLLLSCTAAFHQPVAAAAEGRSAGLPVIKATYLGKSISSEPFGHYPDFAVGIVSELTDGKKSYCTGAALTPSIVLTAGHCLTDAATVTLNVISDQASSATEAVPAAAWIRHPMYNGGREGPMLQAFSNETAEDYVDLGLIRLPSPSPHLTPVTLIPDGYDILANAKPWLFVLGIQRDEWFRVTGGFSLSEFAATERISPSVYVSDMAGEEGWCVRDSGGPVTMPAKDEADATKHFLVGVSFAFFKPLAMVDAAGLRDIWGSLDKVPRCGTRVGFLDVRSQLDWIRESADGLIAGEGARIRQWDD